MRHKLPEHSLPAENIAAEYDAGDSIQEIALRHGTYPKKIHRLLKDMGKTCRTPGEAMRLRMARGEIHPRTGKTHTADARRQISASLKERLSGEGQAAGQAFLKMAEIGPENLRLMSRKGSRIEAKLVDHLGQRVAERRTRVSAGGRWIRVAALLHGFPPVVLLVHGPSHWNPAFGPAKLATQQANDERAVSDLLNGGFSIIRVNIRTRSVSPAAIDRLGKTLSDTLITSTTPITITLEG